MACSDVHIMLAFIPGKIRHDTYEIRIDPNGVPSVEILREDVLVQSVTLQTSLLSCYVYKYFWVSWADGLIEIGTGYQADGGRVLYWLDPDPLSVTAIHFSTSGQYHSGGWQFTKPQGKC